ncbi:MAG: hypothetical protein ACRD5D_05265, partial [Candidatus Polarisedimenticolia bacterium]
TLPEAALALLLVGLLATVSAPAALERLARARVAAAGREIAMEMARLRAEAITGGRHTGLRLEWRGGSYRFAPHADGDGDGIRSEDAAAGIDPPLRPARDLRSRYAGIDFGLLDAAIPEVPPGTGALAPHSDPVRFGRSDIVSFSPRGTSSSGTLYISDGRRAVAAIVLYGGTGRIRVWSYDRHHGRWNR